MQKWLIIICSFFFFTNCAAQFRSDSLRNKAYTYFFEGIHYDSAIYYYKKIADKSMDNVDTYVLYQIGRCYMYLNENTKAKESFLTGLNRYDTDSTDFFYSPLSEGLADVLISEGNYGEALLYLNLSKTKYNKPKHRMCRGTHGDYESRLEFAYKKAICYYGLCQKESAIDILLPLIFRPRWDVFLDTAEYDKISIFFANTVIELYGKGKARDLLHQAVQNTVYISTRKRENKPRPISYNIECYLYFLNYKIELEHFNYTDLEENASLSFSLSKDGILKDFTDSPAYYFITR